MRNKSILFIVLVAIASSFLQCKRPQSDAKEITKLVITADKDYQGNIAGTKINFTDTIPYEYTQVIIKTLDISPKANADKNVGDKLHAGGDAITIVAEDGSAQPYNISFINGLPPTPAPVNTKPIVSTVEVSSITVSGATLSGTIVKIGSSNVTAHGLVWGSSNTPTITGTGFSKNDLGAAATSGTSFTATITGLSDNSTYYIRAYATNSVGTGYGDVKSFTTLESAGLSSLSGTSQVTITEVQSESGSNPTVEASSRIESVGSGTIIQHGHIYGFKNEDLVLNNNNVKKTDLGSKNTLGTFSSSLTNLNFYTTYYIRPYLVTQYSSQSNVNKEQRNKSNTENYTEIIYGVESSFMTPDGPPNVSIGNINPGLTNVTVSGAITNLGASDAVVSYGQIWSTTSGNLTIASPNKTTNSNTTELISFNSALINLTKNTQYYTRFYATNSLGTDYSEQASFKTLNDETEILSLSIRVSLSGGSVFNQSKSQVDGTISGTNIVFSGLPIGATQAIVSEVTLSDQANALLGVNTLTGGSKLSVGVNTINVRASNANSQSYTITLESLTYQPPAVTTLSATSVSYTSANLNGNITSTGTSSISGYGFIYSTSNSAVLTLTGSGTKVQVGGTKGVGSFTNNITELVEGTTYYYVAYAINATGTTYGIKSNFATLSHQPPAVSTLSASNISYTSFTLNGDITSTGTTSISGYGFIYSTSSGATLTLTGNGTTIQVGATMGAGTYNYSLTGLSSNTTYYYVAYTRNNSATVYGAKSSVSTLQKGLPSVSTMTASNISGTGIFLVGNLLSLGGGYSSVSQYGFVYSNVISGNSFVASGSSLVVDGSGVNTVKLGTKTTLSTFTNTITGLSSNTTHYVRAYATNASGTSYGTELSFTPSNSSSNQVIGVATAAQLQAIRNNLAGTYIQTADIDLSSISNFSPIGTNGSPAEPFTGSFDGNGFVIRNLKITNNNTYGGVGLFGYINTNAVVKNVALENVYITGNTHDVGAIVGTNGASGTITNSYATGGFIIAETYGGGLVGKNYGTLTNSYANVNVHSVERYAGGLVGWNLNSNANIENCYAMGAAQIGINVAGGLAANNSSSASITKTYTTGNIVGSSDIGGLTPFNSATVTDSYWNEETSGRTSSAAGTSRTTSQMLQGNTNYSGFSNTHWDFGNNSSYPTLKTNIATAEKQSVHQAVGLLQLSVSGTSNFFGDSVNQNTITVNVEAGATTGATLFVLDVNGAASNDSARVDYWDCTAGTGNTLLTTNSINGTSVTLRFASSGTTDKTAWTKAEGTNCNIIRSNTGTSPYNGDTLSVEAVISKGSETFTKSFTITFGNLN